jgi:hypothetical protein
MDLPAAPGSVIPLPLAAEFGLAQESDAYPKTEYSNLQFRGPLDVDAFRAAFDETARAVPLFRAVLEERRIGSVYRLCWVVRDRPNELVYDDCRDRVPTPLDAVAFVEEYHRARTVKRLDLRTEYPVRFFLLRLADDVHLLSTIYHHAGFDAAGGFAFFRDLLATYHARVTGERPAWADAPAITSSAAPPRTVARPVSTLRYFLSQMWDIRVRVAGRVSLIASEGTREALGRTAHRAVFGKEEVRGLLGVAKRNEATLTDVLMAGVARSIGAWDREHGLKEDVVRGLLSVNIRTAASADGAEGVRLSGINVNAVNPERLAPDAAVKLYRDGRKDQLARGADVAFYRLLGTIARGVLAVPVRWREPLARKLLEVPVTFLLSNIGVMWPAIENGRPTARSAVTGAGGLVIDDVHSCPSAAPYVGMLVIARTLGGTLFVNFSCDRRRFTRPEAAALTGRIAEELRAMARG